jgi:hypothetical protein
MTADVSALGSFSVGSPQETKPEPPNILFHRAMLP